MSIEITGIVGQAGPPAGRPAVDPAVTTRAQEAETAPTPPDIELDRMADDLEKVSTAFNRRLQFSVNREINRVIVKVVDRETDKVIKELPSEEVQRLHVRIREAIGLLIDEEI